VKCERGKQFFFHLPVENCWSKEKYKDFLKRVSIPFPRLGKFSTENFMKSKNVKFKEKKEIRFSLFFFLLPPSFTTFVISMRFE
jgi:hypothetical protein